MAGEDVLILRKNERQSECCLLKRRSALTLVSFRTSRKQYSRDGVMVGTSLAKELSPQVHLGIVPQQAGHAAIRRMLHSTERLALYQSNDPEI